jgi:hypothetical protein
VKPCRVILFEVFVLSFKKLRLFVEESFSLPRDSGILPRGDCCYRRCECLSAGQSLCSLYFRFLFLVPEDSAEHPFRPIDLPSMPWQCSRMLCTLATNSRLGFPAPALGQTFRGAELPLLGRLLPDGESY